MAPPLALIKAYLIRSGRITPVSAALTIPVKAGGTAVIRLVTDGNVFLPDTIHVKCTPSGVLTLTVSVDGARYFEVDACSYDTFPDVLDFTSMGWPWVARRELVIEAENTGTVDAELVVTYTGGLMAPDAYAYLEEIIDKVAEAWLGSRRGTVSSS